MELEAEQSQLLEQKGMKINTVDLAPFRDQSRSAYKLFTDKFGDAMLKRITTAGGQK